MIAIQYIYIFLYINQWSVCTYSKVITRPNPDSDFTKFLQLFQLFESPITKDLSNVVINSDDHLHMDWSPDYEYDEVTCTDANNYIENEEQSMIDNYNSKAIDYILSVKSSVSKVKRAVELVEEHPPEGTARPSYNEGENLTPRSSSSIPSVPSISQPPTMPSQEPKNTLDAEKNNELTTSPNVEVLETTTEDYGNIGEPNCEYDPFTFILKCGLNLITSIFGLSDSCCKSLF